MRNLFLFVLVVFVLSVGLIACESGSNSQSMPSQPTPNTANFRENSTSDTFHGNGDKVLVTYFSNTGNTKVIAGMLADITKAGLYEIVPAVAYTADDLNYRDPYTRATKEQNDDSTRPEIATTSIDMAEYDTIFIGYPIWWGQAPRIINTFLEKYDFSGKTIIPFCTSNSSGIGSSTTKLSAFSSDTVAWQAGQCFTPKNQKEDLKTWLISLGIISAETAEMPYVTNNNSFNLKTQKVKLNTGYDMPIVGLGTYSLRDSVCVNAVSVALENGYRLIDTAYMYHNEESVGQGIKKSGISREEIFVITKLYMNQYPDAENAINEALKKLDVEYIDLMLLHHPGDDDVKAYQAMEKAMEAGKIRSIGLSNYYIKELEKFLPKITIMPALVQNEIHPYYQETEVINYIHAKGIVMQAWYPLGGRGYTKALFNNKTIAEIAKNYNKSAAQIILRWHLQRNVVAIPGSSNPNHIKENMNIFDFELTSAEMQKINELDRNEKHDWY